MPFIGGGGVEKNLYLIANYLDKKTKNLFICTISKNKKKKFSKNIKFISPQKKISENLNIRVKYFVCLILLFVFLIRNKNSVVISFQANIYCIILCKLLNIKIIVRSNSSPYGWYHNYIKKLIYKSIISLADKVIVNSLDFKMQMTNMFNIKVVSIYNPLNIDQILKKAKIAKKESFFKPDNNCLKILNIGRLTEQKDQITILKAANILKKKINFKLIIVGNGIEKNNLEKYITKNKLNKIVKIKNFLSNPFGLIKQSDIFVLSSKYEGLPNVLLEAASLKKFIISTKCPTGPREILQNGKGGLFFKIGNPDDLAKKILFYLKHKKKMNSKINSSFRNLKNYDFKKNMDKYVSLIESII